MAKLTAKQQRFCDEYLIDLNATQAAIRAGYSKKTAYKASDWLNEKSQEKPSSKFNRAMREYIDNRLAEKEKALKSYLLAFRSIRSKEEYAHRLKELKISEELRSEIREALNHFSKILEKQAETDSLDVMLEKLARDYHRSTGS